jgi:hypothetical protein
MSMEDLLARQRLPVPHTWEELATVAAALQQRRLVTDGLIWQGAPYEG